MKKFQVGDIVQVQDGIKKSCLYDAKITSPINETKNEVEIKYIVCGRKETIKIERINELDLKSGRPKRSLIKPERLDLKSFQSLKRYDESVCTGDSSKYDYLDIDTADVIIECKGKVQVGIHRKRKKDMDYIMSTKVEEHQLRRAGGHVQNVQGEFEPERQKSKQQHIIKTDFFVGKGVKKECNKKHDSFERTSSSSSNSYDNDKADDNHNENSKRSRRIRKQTDFFMGKPQRDHDDTRNCVDNNNNEENDSDKSDENYEELYNDESEASSSFESTDDLSIDERSRRIRKQTDFFMGKPQRDHDDSSDDVDHSERDDVNDDEILNNNESIASNIKECDEVCDDDDVPKNEDTSTNHNKTESFDSSDDELDALMRNNHDQNISQSGMKYEYGYI